MDSRAPSPVCPFRHIGATCWDINIFFHGLVRSCEISLCMLAFNYQRQTCWKRALRPVLNASSSSINSIITRVAPLLSKWSHEGILLRMPCRLLLPPYLPPAPTQVMAPTGGQVINQYLKCGGRVFLMAVKPINHEDHKLPLSMEQA